MHPKGSSAYWGVLFWSPAKLLMKGEPGFTESYGHFFGLVANFTICVLFGWCLKVTLYFQALVLSINAFLTCRTMTDYFNDLDMFQS